jgi:hypothetical protein
MPKIRSARTISEQPKALELPQSFTQEKRLELLQQLASLHDYAKELMAAVEETEDAHLRKKQEAIATTLATQVHCSTDIIITFYNEVAFKGGRITPELREVFEAALQNIHIAYHEFREQIGRASCRERVSCCV